ncbi:hypothetical protein Tco_1302457 [Tanacetum coccineum]
MLKHSRKPFDQVARAEFDQKYILFKMTRESKSYEKHPTHQALYDAIMQSLILDEYDMEKAKATEPPTQKKRRHEDKDQDPPAGSDQGMKKRKKSKDAEPSKRLKSIGSSKGTTQSQLKSTGDDMGNTDEQPNVEAAQKYDWFKKLPRSPTPNPKWNKGNCVELDYNIEECYRALSDQPDWKNPEGDRCPYDLSKPLTLQESHGRLTVPTDFFFNNDLEYLRACADNHSPMLEKDMYDSWKSIMELYMLNRQHGRMILKSVENGPLIWPSIEENGVTRPKKYSKLSTTEAIQADCDIKAAKIILK